VAPGEHVGNRLGAFLCWAVVFADIGTSVYYVPGILYGQVHLLAGLFVSLTLLVFLLLTLKYAEVSVRFPEGGGVVTVAARALNPWAGAVGGMFILVDYFLTSAISSDSGLQYFDAIFTGIKPYVLPAALLVLALLGLLNWWGIRESASVSAFVAVAAFVTNMAIIIAVLINVPLHAIGQVIGEMFAGSITPVVMLTGFSGAFLAFSGLESISQLSPVMALPRRKTVTLALALVVITVGITSPLLTIFSTTLLTSCTPHFTACSPEIWQANYAHGLLGPTNPDPDKFISELAAVAGGTTFGRLLEVLTALTASTLLVFASNTAIIGAYHVFLALSRMRFFPSIVERRNKWRGTPHVSILLATVIPMLVLVAVQGNITILGDMYAFGLLGAFTLTCVALDVLRTRERRMGIVADLTELEQEAPLQRELAVGEPAVNGRGRLGTRLHPAIVRLRMLRRVYFRRRARLSRRAGPVTDWAKRVWPDVKYYLGLLTTLLVGIAWVTNLIAKPLATQFGGGVTVLGVAIAVIHYRYQMNRGEQPVFPMAVLQPILRSFLVVLRAGSPANEQVIRAAAESADGHPLVFLFEGKPEQRTLQVMQFNDPYYYDEEAQRTFSMAARISKRLGVTETRFVYRIGGTPAVLSAWRIIQPDEIIAEASVAKSLSRLVAPEYIRYQTVDGVRIAHYVRHHVTGLTQPGAGTTGGPRRPGGQGGPGGPGGQGGPGALAGPAVQEPDRRPAPVDAPILQDAGVRAAANPSPPPQRAKTTPPTVAPRKPLAKPPVNAAASPASRKPSANGSPPTTPRKPTTQLPSRPGGQQAAPHVRRPVTSGKRAAAPTRPLKRAASTPRAPEPPSAPSAPSTNIDDYVWTGTQLVRRDELEQQQRDDAEQR
jgi:amino acid transporter